MEGMKRNKGIQNRANPTTHPDYECYRWRKAWLVKTWSHGVSLLFPWWWIMMSCECWLKRMLAHSGLWSNFIPFILNLLGSFNCWDTHNHKNIFKNPRMFWPHPLLRFELIHMIQRQTKQSHHSCYAAQSTEKEV